ncbi:MAG: hypothetical protein QOH30_2982 [Baekduia sp.]|nr:hypothetical protein [Baekduia sp.]
MVSSRVVATLATAAAFTAATPLAAQAAPSAHAAGGAPVVVTYPSIVNERLVRVQASLDRATQYADEHNPNLAASTLMTARTNIKKAWTAAQYVIQNAPPPVAADAAFHPQSFTRSGRLKIRSIHGKLRAHAAGGAVAGAVASPEDTAFAVLSLQHRMATLATGLIDTAHSTLLSSLSTTLFTALNGRDQAIAYIHSIDTPAPAAAAGGAVATAAGTAPTGSAWATVMPGLIPLIDDELQQVNGTLADTTVGAGARRVVQDALAQDTKAEAAVNQFWPPLPAAG